MRRPAVVGTAIGLILIGIAGVLGILHLNTDDPSGIKIDDPVPLSKYFTKEQIVQMDLELEKRLADSEFPKRDPAGFSRAQREHVKVHDVAQEAGGTPRAKEGP